MNLETITPRADLEEGLRFKTLGMEDTSFFLPQNKVSRLARAYTYSTEKGHQPFLDTQTIEEGAFVNSADYPYRGPQSYFSGGGGLCSTAKDYHRFCQMMLNGGTFNGTQMLSRKSGELVSQNHLQGKMEDTGFGLGFGVTSEARHLKELGSIVAYYWSRFFYTSFVIDPKEDIVAIFLGQFLPLGT